MVTHQRSWLATAVLLTVLLLVGSAAAADNPAAARIIVSGTSDTDPTMHALLAVKNLGVVRMYCFVDVNAATQGGFAFQNTTPHPLFVSGGGMVEPGETLAVFGLGTQTFQVTTLSTESFRIATIVVSGYLSPVTANTCVGHAQALVQS